MMRYKVDAGAQHLVSRLFFDNEDFFRFLERCRIAGIDVPIEAGAAYAIDRIYEAAARYFGRGFISGIPKRITVSETAIFAGKSRQLCFV